MLGQGEKCVQRPWHRSVSRGLRSHREAGWAQQGSGSTTPAPTQKADECGKGRPSLLSALPSVGEKSWWAGQDGSEGGQAGLKAG